MDGGEEREGRRGREGGEREGEESEGGEREGEEREGRRERGGGEGGRGERRGGEGGEGEGKRDIHVDITWQTMYMYNGTSVNKTTIGIMGGVDTPLNYLE